MFREIGGVLVNTVAFGSEGPVILGVGGWTGNWELWQQPFELLSGRWQTIAYDHFGAGETVVPVDHLTFDHQVETVFGVMEAFGIERCILAGESNGAAVVMAAAIRAPDRFDGLVLVDGPHSGFDNPGTHAFVEALRANYPATIAAFVDRCTPEPNVEHIRRWARNILLKSDAETAIRLLECMYGLDLRPRLPEIQQRTLIIHGELDALTITLPSVAEETARLIPDSTLHIVRGAGHVPPLTRPQEVAGTIERFFSHHP